jgi:hypothetical protein
MTNDNVDQNVMQNLLKQIQEGKLPNSNQNINQNMGMNPNMGMNQNMGMNPNMNPNMMNPNMGMGGFNPNMQMNPNFFMNQNMMGNFGMPFFPPFPFQNQFQGQQQQPQQQQQQSSGENWTLIFERKYDVNKINVQVNSDDTVLSAFNKYRIKSLENNIPLKFTFNKKPLNESLTLSASGLRDNSIIEVEKTNAQNNVPPARPGFLSLLFEKEGYGNIMIQIESSKTVREAILAYKNKMGLMNTDETFMLIFNSKTLQENWTLAQAGLTNGSKITVIATKNLIGA